MQSEENTIKAFPRTAVDLHREHRDTDIGTSLMKTNDQLETFLKSVAEPLLGSALKGPTSHKLVPVWGSLGRAGFCLHSQRAQEHVSTPSLGDGIRESLVLVPVMAHQGYPQRNTLPEAGTLIFVPQFNQAGSIPSLQSFVRFCP